MKKICQICKYADNAAKQTAKPMLFPFNEQCSLSLQTDNVITRCFSLKVSCPRWHCALFAWLSHGPPLMEKLITSGVIAHDTGVNLIMLTK